MIKNYLLLMSFIIFMYNLESLNFTFEKMIDISDTQINSFVTDKNYSWNYNLTSNDIISIINEKNNYKIIIKYHYINLEITKIKYIVIDKNLKKLKEFTTSDEIELLNYKNRFIFADKNRLIKQIDTTDDLWIKNENTVYREFLSNLKNYGSRKDRIPEIFKKSYFFLNTDSFYCLDKEGDRLLQYDLKKKTLRNIEIPFNNNSYLLKPIINDRFLVFNEIVGLYSSFYNFYDIKTNSFVFEITERTLLSKIPFSLGDYRDWYTSELFCSNGDFYLWIYCKNRLTIFKVFIK